MVKNGRLDAALEYVRRGWEIFPVPPGTKSGYSVQSRGFDNGKPWGKTTSVKEVRAYWKQLPRANIGVPMGVGSGIFDIECDTKEGHPNLVKDGIASLHELEAKHGKLPATLIFESPTGSRHHLFKHPGGDVRIRMDALDKEKFPGIDCKGDGSMSVMPPSKTRKGMYKWINKRRIARAPQWLLTMVIKQEQPREADYFQQFANSMKKVNMGELRLATAMIPNDLKTSREQWVTVGLALWSATNGSEEGYQIFAAWSRRWPDYDAKNTRKFWDTIKKPPDNITVGTIYHLAEEAEPDWKARICSRDPKIIKLLREFHNKLLEE